MEKGLRNSFIELENSWVIIGGWLYKISQLIDSENDQSTEWKSVTGFTSFSNYLVEKWNYSNPHKGFKERSAFKNLIENKPELLKEYKSNKMINFPGFTLLSLLESYKELMDNVEWISMLEKVYSGELSRKELEELNPKKVEKSSNSLKVDDDSEKDSLESPYKFFDESYNDEKLAKINIDRKSILLKELPDLKEKVIYLFPGEQSEKVLSLIEQIEDELRLIITTKVAA